MPDDSFGISQLIKRVAKKVKVAVCPYAHSNLLNFLRNYARRRQRALSPATELFAAFAQDRFSHWEALDAKALLAAQKKWWVQPPSL